MSNNPNKRNFPGGWLIFETPVYSMGGTFSLLSSYFTEKSNPCITALLVTSNVNKRLSNASNAALLVTNAMKKNAFCY